MKLTILTKSCLVCRPQNVTCEVRRTISHFHVPKLHGLKGLQQGIEGEVVLGDTVLHDELGLICQSSFQNIVHDIWDRTTTTDVKILEFQKN